MRMYCCESEWEYVRQNNYMLRASEMPFLPRVNVVFNCTSSRSQTSGNGIMNCCARSLAPLNYFYHTC